VGTCTDLASKLRAAILDCEAVVSSQRKVAMQAQSVAAALGVSPGVSLLPLGLAKAYLGSKQIPVTPPQTPLEIVMALCECANPAIRPAEFLATPEAERRAWALEGSFNLRAQEHTDRIRAQEIAEQNSVVGQYCAKHSLLGLSMIEAKMRAAAVDNVRLNRDTPQEGAARQQLAGLESLRKASKWPSTQEFEAFCLSGDLSWAEQYAPEVAKRIRLTA
jgi:hypothetical protein